MTRRLISVDSVCWIAILNSNDELHEEADTEYKKLMTAGFYFATSTAVLNEIANTLSKLKKRLRQLQGRRHHVA